ncbi:MAG: hypothetical protein OEU54_05045 [Gemmatimonadota bacterium]|nr:hypothetical protein [Gemmatimonadota bacterium]
MARHNREGRGLDQLGNLWRISFQPDWLKHVKISRPLPKGRRRSSLTLFRNPARAAQSDPGRSIRTRITSLDGEIDVEVSLEDRDLVVDHVVLAIRRRHGRKTELVKFVLQGGLPRTRR